MPATSIAGAVFTVSVGATDYSAQVTTGTVTSTSTITRTRTLGPGNAFTQTDLINAVTLSFLHDGDAGLYNAISDKADSGASVAVVITGGTSTWTGAAMYVESVDVTFDATGVAMCSCSLTGTLVIT
jgi:hypothetical protein